MFNNGCWIPIQERNDSKNNNNKKLWCIGMSEYNLICIPLGKDEIEPLAITKPM